MASTSLGKTSFFGLCTYCAKSNAEWVVPTSSDLMGTPSCVWAASPEPHLAPSSPVQASSDKHPAPCLKNTIPNLTLPQSSLSKLLCCLFLFHVRPVNKQNLRAFPHVHDGSTIDNSLGWCHFPFWSYFVQDQKLDLIILVDAFQLRISCDSVISSCFLLPGREIFTVTAMAMCVIPEHDLSPFCIKAGVSCVVSFQQACLLTVTLPMNGSSIVTHCYHGLPNDKYSAGWLNHFVFPMIALSKKNKSQEEEEKMSFRGTTYKSYKLFPGKECSVYKIFKVWKF